MSTIKHVGPFEVKEPTTLYIDGKQGTVLSVDWNDSTEMTVISYEDANGEHVAQFATDETVPVLVG